ncbi:MAG: elongation factor P [Candidatus Puniceispirillum sp.]|nr:elongation factor P [Candidatus Pelagibacter sp.]MBA4283430.1 elongation factor P [Candidatus Puniceispirillum sp.]
MKISGNEIRVGNILDYQGKLWTVTKTQHTQPGKGGAYMQVEMKSIAEGTKLNERFRSAETVERVYLDEVAFQYLYDDGENLVFMDQQTFEQIYLSKDFVGASAVFLIDNMVVNLSMYEGKPIAVQLPDHVVLEIMEADAVVKGQTASSSYKPAVLTNGVRIMVPPHISTGMKVVVNTIDGTYVERYKEV